MMYGYQPPVYPGEFGYGPPMMYGPPMYYGQRPPFQGMRPMYPPPGAPVYGYQAPPPYGGGAPYMHARPMPYMEHADPASAASDTSEAVPAQPGAHGQTKILGKAHMDQAKIVDDQRACTVCGKLFNKNDVASFNRHVCVRKPWVLRDGRPTTGPDSTAQADQSATDGAALAGEANGNDPSSLAADAHVAVVPLPHAQRAAAVRPEGAAAPVVRLAADTTTAANGLATVRALGGATAASLPLAAARPVMTRYARLVCSHEPAPGEVVFLTLRRTRPDERWGVRLAGDERPRVKSIDHTALAWQQGVRAGDVLLTIDGQRCAGHADTTDVLRKAVGTLKVEVSRRQYRLAAETLQRYQRGVAARRALAGQLGAERAVRWARAPPVVGRSASTEYREMDREITERARVLAAQEVAWKRAVEETKEAEAKVAEARAVASAASKLREAAEAGAFEAEKVADQHMAPTGDRRNEAAMTNGQDGRGRGRGRGGGRGGRGRSAAREAGGTRGGDQADGPVRAQPAWAALLSES